MPDPPLPKETRAPGLRCGHGTGWDNFCGREATWHIIEDGDTLANHLTCDEHRDFALPGETFYAVHDYDPVCSLIDIAKYHHPPVNRCIVEDGDLGLYYWGGHDGVAQHLQALRPRAERPGLTWQDHAGTTLSDWVREKWGWDSSPGDARAGDADVTPPDPPLPKETK